jgi:hypothetical protein
MKLLRLGIQRTLERETHFLEAVHWSTHAFPEIGERPQALINKQLVDRSSLLIAIFWKSLGSPTGVAKSGTIEEIERFRESGRPVMLYFSEAPVPHDADIGKLKQVRKYRESLQDTLYSVFKSRSQFKQKLSVDLPQVIANFEGRHPDSHSHLHPPKLFEDKMVTLNRIEAELETTRLIKDFPKVLEKLKQLLLDCISLPKVGRIKDARKNFQYLINRVSDLERFSFNSGTMAQFSDKCDELFTDLRSAIEQIAAIEGLAEWEVVRYEDLKAKQREHTEETAWNWPEDRQCQCGECRECRALRFRIKDDLNPRFRAFILRLERQLQAMQPKVTSSPKEIWEWIAETAKTAKRFEEQFQVNDQLQNARLAGGTVSAFQKFAELDDKERLQYDETRFNTLFAILGTAVKTLRAVVGSWPEP